MTRAVLRIMREQKSGVVGFIGSVVSLLFDFFSLVAIHMLTINRVAGRDTLLPSLTALLNSLQNVSMAVCMPSISEGGTRADRF